MNKEQKGEPEPEPKKPPVKLGDLEPQRDPKGGFCIAPKGSKLDAGSSAGESRSGGSLLQRRPSLEPQDNTIVAKRDLRIEISLLSERIEQSVQRLEAGKITQHEANQVAVEAHRMIKVLQTALDVLDEEWGRQR